MTHRLNLFLLLLALAVFGPFFWLLIENPSRAVPPQPLAIADLRQLADQIPGPAPIAVETTLVGWDRMPGNVYAAGSGIKRRLFSVLAFRLVVPGQGGVVIDTGTSPRLAAAADLEGFEAHRQAIVDEWMTRATIILATSELPQHLGGLAALAARTDEAMALTRARLNPAQVPGAPGAASVGWPAKQVLRPAISGTRPRAVAPGVVVIPTRAPTPGSQMVFVRLADGREYLFTGDVAPFDINVTELRVRSNLIDRDRGQDSRRATMRWLLTIQQIRAAAPGLTIVAGHDYDRIAQKENPQGIGIVGSDPEPHNPAGK